MTTERPCPKCETRPKAPNQGYCLECRALYKRAARLRKNGSRPDVVTPKPATVTTITDALDAYGLVPAAGGVSQKAAAATGTRGDKPIEGVVVDRPSYQAYPDREPAESWYRDFLKHFAENGSPRLAANHVGRPLRDIESARERDAAFAEEYEDARAFYVELIEWESVDLARRKNNPLGYFGRLKADQPERYVERAQIASVTNILNVGAPEMDRDAGAFLAGLLSAATPATRAELAAGRLGDIIYVTPSDVTPSDPAK
jgi:hypothetical protein